jgi:hypothetical protein
MTELEINGIKYRCTKMPIFDQAHVARKVAPIFMGMGKGYAEAMTQAANGHAAQDPEVEENTFLFQVAAPIAEVLSKMSDIDVDYVLKKCLGAVQRFTGQQWVPMVRGGQLMFEDDLDLPTLIQLTVEVVQDNLGPSLRGVLAPTSPNGDLTSRLPSLE